MDKLLTAGRRSILSAILGLLLLACTGHRDPELDVQAPAGAAPVTDDSVDLGTFLPPPHSLLLQPVFDKQASYSETDYIRYGLDFDTNVPHQNVGLSGYSALFSPTWAEPANTTYGDLAFCIYRFINISVFTRAPEVHYGWEVPPTDINTAWLGLADWDRDRWDWRRCNAEGSHALPGFEPYTSSTDEMLVAMVVANSENPALRWIRLGPVVVDAQLTLVPDQGIAPVTVEGRADGSTTLVTALDRFEWDWDNDGVFEDDTGATDTASHTYAAAGEHTATVRVSNTYGESATASATLEAIQPWEHSWGLGGTEYVYGAAADDAGGLYFVGNTYHEATLLDVLVLKYDVAGNCIWAKTWAGAGDENAHGAVWADGGLYVTGYTTSYGAGDADVLLQRWDASGNLEWTGTWGDGGMDISYGIARVGSALYCAGQTCSFSHPNGDGLLIKYGTDGTVQWARSVGGTDQDSFVDLEAIWHPFSDSTDIHLVGDTYSYSGGANKAILYASFTGEAALVDLYAWNDSTTASGTAISAYGAFDTEVYILGQNSSGQIILTELGTSTGLANKLWDISGFTYGYDILRINDSLEVCGADGFLSTDGVLVNFTLDGAIQGAETWDIGVDQAAFYYLQAFPGSGLLLCGPGGHAAGGSWSLASGTLADATGVWCEVPPQTIYTPGGATASPTLAPGDLTGGVLDTGGGSHDALIIARNPL